MYVAPRSFLTIVMRYAPRPAVFVLCPPVPAGQVLDTGQHTVLHEGGGAIDAGGYGSNGGTNWAVTCNPPSPRRGPSFILFF